MVVVNIWWIGLILRRSQVCVDSFEESDSEDVKMWCMGRSAAQSPENLTFA